MKKLLIALALCLTACGVVPRPPVPTPVPPVDPLKPPVTVAIDLVACRTPFVDNYCDGPAGATFALEVAPNVWKTYQGDGNGYVFVPDAPNVPDSRLTIAAPGYITSGPFHIDINHTPPIPTDLVAVNAAGVHNYWNLQPIPPPHVDPSQFTLNQLAAIRGAMWTVRGPWDFGPRPNQPDNITALEFIYSYGNDPAHLTDTQKNMLATYKSHGYTHVAFGPPNAQSYHGQYPDVDFTISAAAFEQWLDWVQVFWDNGLAPVIFLHPDGATLEQTQALYNPLLTGNARAQRLLRIVVPTGWEPTRYDWSSRTWGAFADWSRGLLPNSLILIHTVADVDAPVGTDARYDDNGHPNSEGWAYVAARIHGWLNQAGAFECPTCVPNADGKTNFQNWVDTFSRNVRGSYYDRFHNGYAGWPRFSLWGSDQPIRIYAGEYCSYWEYWQNRPYDECTAWGDAAVSVGADGYLDSGTKPVDGSVPFKVAGPVWQGDSRAFFEAVVQGRPFGQQTLLDVMPQLEAYCFKLTPANAVGDRTKIGDPVSKRWTRVGFGEGHWVWLQQGDVYEPPAGCSVN